MVADEVELPSKSSRGRGSRKQITPRRYVSKHFKQSKPVQRASPQTAKPVPTPITTGFPEENSRVYQWSSDSTLTDVPSDIGPDPFPPSNDEDFPKVVAVKIKRPSTSPYFPNKARPQFLSCLPFPPLSDKTFGLMQEKLAHDPFRMLVATIFLNKTPGERAMPVFYQLMKRYPTVEALAKANVSDVTAIIQHLGFQNQRAHKCVALATKWHERPPTHGKRVRKLHYPEKGDGRDVGKEELLDDADSRVGWEISHLPGLGPYSHDSWRIFCRDELRGLSRSWLGEGVSDPDFEPEWKRVVPTDKELRAYLTWQWLKEGWIWNKETGHRHRADEKTMREAQGGGIIQEVANEKHLVIRADSRSNMLANHPAGDFMPS